METATLELKRSDRDTRKPKEVLFVERPKRIGRMAAQQQGPAPELSGPYFLENPGELNEGEFDLSPQKEGAQIEQFVIGLERSIVHTDMAVVCCSLKQWKVLETLDGIPFCRITREAGMMRVSTPAGTFRLWIIDANHVRFVPISG